MNPVVNRTKFKKRVVLEVGREGALEIESGRYFRLREELVEGESKVNR